MTTVLILSLVDHIHMLFLEKMYKHYFYSINYFKHCNFILRLIVFTFKFVIHFILSPWRRDYELVALSLYSLFSLSKNGLITSLKDVLTNLGISDHEIIKSFEITLDFILAADNYPHVVNRQATKTILK